jgi:energy-coupling factor transporter ATP-binding protein EcfA2
MRFKSLSIQKAGPLRNLQLDFGDVNLIIGNNEAGKTTFIDILIQRLFEKKTGFAKPLWNNRFEFGEDISLSIEDKPESEEKQNFYSLFVIREGENQWKGKSAKNELLSPDFWNKDVKEMIHGNDWIYSKISKELEKILGISKSNSWLSVFYKNLESFQKLLDEEELAVEQMKKNEAWIAQKSKELKEAEAELLKMTDARKFSESRLNREWIENFFSLTDSIEKNKDKIEKLEKKNLDKIREEWKSLKNSLSLMEKEKRDIQSSLSSSGALKNDRLRQSQELEKESEMIQKEIHNLELEIEKTKLKASKEAKESVFTSEKPSGFIHVSAAFLVLTGILGLFLSLSVQLQWILLEINSVFLFFSGLLLTAAGSAVWIIAFVQKKSSSKKWKEWELSRKNSDNEIRSIEKQCEIHKNQLSKISEKIESLHKESNHYEKGALEWQEKLANLETTGKELIEKEASFERLYLSIEELLKEKDELTHLKKDLLRQEEELENLKVKLLRKYSSVSTSFLKETLDQLTESQETNPGQPSYKEEKFNHLTAEKDRLQSEISQKHRENEKINGEVLTKINEGLKNLSSKVNPEYIERFYSQVKNFHIGHDIFNIYAFRKDYSEFFRKVEEDIRFSELIQKSYHSVLSNLDSLIKNVIKSEQFQGNLKKITAGFYSDCDFEMDKDGLRLFLKGPGDTSYEFSTLSTGAKNQFYFALRLALASTQFTSEKGVFILDDAFLTFDEKRRRSSLNLLKEYAASGWQIIYSSVNEKSMEKLFEEVFKKKLNKMMITP